MLLSFASKDNVFTSSDMNSTIPLLPVKARLIGFLLIFPGLAAGYLYYFGGKPSVFEIPVFAIVTSYLETRFMVLAQTNILDETAAVCIISGLICIGFSRLQQEDSFIASLRVRALFMAVYCSAILWIALFLLVFGWPILIVSSLVFLFFLLTNILVFQILLIRNKREHNIKLKNPS